MSSAFHTYLFSPEDEITEGEYFEKVKKYFRGIENVRFEMDLIPLINRNSLKMCVDGVFVVNFFFEKDPKIATDFSHIIKSDNTPGLRIRFLMTPDKNNDFDEIGVMVLQFISEFKTGITYSPNLNKVIEE